MNKPDYKSKKTQDDLSLLSDKWINICATDTKKISAGLDLIPC